ncbi:MAG: heavy-metal-associated domain-containing protein [Ignavibacteria bacterium]
MKYFFLVLLAMLSLQVTTITALPIQERVITVYGNCGSCKKAIEKAVKSVDGVESANWDKKKKTLTIAYEDTKTSLNLIEKAITAIGYDTENLFADDTVYENLHSCCKYERKPR